MKVIMTVIMTVIMKVIMKAIISQSINTVDGCEILHHQQDGWKPLNNGGITGITFFNFSIYWE